MVFTSTTGTIAGYKIIRHGCAFFETYPIYGRETDAIYNAINDLSDSAEADGYNAIVGLSATTTHDDDYYRVIVSGTYVIVEPNE